MDLGRDRQFYQLTIGSRLSFWQFPVELGPATYRDDGEDALSVAVHNEVRNESQIREKEHMMRDLFISYSMKDGRGISGDSILNSSRVGRSLRLRSGHGKSVSWVLLLSYELVFFRVLYDAE